MGLILDCFVIFISMLIGIVLSGIFIVFLVFLNSNWVVVGKVRLVLNIRKLICVCVMLVFLVLLICRLVMVVS